LRMLTAALVQRCTKKTRWYPNNILQRRNRKHFDVVAIFTLWTFWRIMPNLYTNCNFQIMPS